LLLIVDLSNIKIQMTFSILSQCCFNY